MPRKFFSAQSLHTSLCKILTTFLLSISIDITFGENTVSHSDKTWISEIIADISSSEPTKKESVQDFPQVESYIKIDFRLETGTSTIFAYEDRGKYYLEQPYQGIYKIDRKLFERLKGIE